LFLDLLLTNEYAFHLQQSLIDNTTLEFLGVIDDSLGPIGAKALGEGIRGSQIQKIEVTQDTECHPSEVLRMLYSDGIRGSLLKGLSLRGDIGSLDGLVSVLRSLGSLTITTFDLRPSMIQILSNGLNQTRRLIHLCLWNCALRDEHVGILSLGLRFHQSITSLQLGSNHIRNAGVCALISNWRLASAIKELDLTANEFGAIGAHRLFQFSSARPNLDRLVLANNKSIGFYGLKLIGEELQNSVLDVGHCAACHPRWHYLARTANEEANAQLVKIDEAAKSLFEGARNNIYLCALNLGVWSVKLNYTYI
jgi:hypothetical protein